jgi:putative starch synthase
MRLVKNGNCYYYGSIFDKRVIINIETFVITIESNKSCTFFDPMWIEGSIAEEDGDEERGILSLLEYLYETN